MNKKIAVIVFGMMIYTISISIWIIHFFFPSTEDGSATKTVVGEHFNDGFHVINWEEKYPFYGMQKLSEEMVTVSTTEDSVIPDKLKKYELYLARVKNFFEQHTVEAFPARMSIIAINNKLCSMMGMYVHTGDDTTLELRDNYFISLTDRINISKTVDYIDDIALWCSENKYNFLYVQAPYKTDKYDKTNVGITDNINKNGDTLIDQLDKNGITQYLDLRTTLNNEQRNIYEMYYGTDHHWKIETGLWAAKEIEAFECDNKNASFDLSELDNEKFSCITYKNRFLGSLGKKVTLTVASLEDFCLVYPISDTDFSVEIPAMDYERRGSFKETLINYRWLNDPNPDYYNEYLYESYCYGNNPIIDIKNNKINDGERVLLISNSYGLAVTPFIAMNCEEIVQLNPVHFSGSVKRYIEEYKPDYVIALFCPSSLKDDEEISNPNDYCLYLE